MIADPRRQQPIKIRWNGMVGELVIDGELWSEVEYSEKHRKWCIQDAEGECLAHKEHIHAFEDDKAAAVALAEAMIRDGRLPSPQDAKTARKERLKRDRERRAKQPSEIRRRAEREERDRLRDAHYEAEEADRDAEPLYEVIADTLDFNDPELWKSNSFACLRLRLIVTIRAAIADLESAERHDEHDIARLARAREILTLLRPDDRPPITMAQVEAAFRVARKRGYSNRYGISILVQGVIDADPALRGLRGDRTLREIVKQLLDAEAACAAPATAK